MTTGQTPSMQQTADKVPDLAGLTVFGGVGGTENKQTSIPITSSDKH